MSTLLLQELHGELRRIYIAGSELAAGDFRLKRLQPQFQQLGERAPVFKKLGDGISALIEPPPNAAGTSAERLQDVALLLASVLRTLGASAPSGAVKETESKTSLLQTHYTYRKLAPVIEALSTTGGGRQEIIVEAFEQGLFQDLRLLQPAIGALEDSYTEIADYAAQHILPAYGKPVLQYLMPWFDPNGKSADCRKLRVIAEVGGEEVVDLLLQCSESGSNEVRAVAISKLAGFEEHVDKLIAWSRDKKKPIREAAFEALVQSRSAEALARVMETFKGKDGELIRYAAYRSGNDELERLITHALEAVLKSAHEAADDAKQLEKLKEEMLHYLYVLEGRRLDLLYDIYLYVAQNAQFYHDMGWLIDIYNYAVRDLELMGTEKELALLFAIEQQVPKYIDYALRTAARILPPNQLYDRYYGLIAGEWLKEDPAERKARADLVISAMSDLLNEQAREYIQSQGGMRSSAHREAAWHNMPMEKLWDERWLDWVMEKNQLNLVSMLSRPNHERCKAYIAEGLQQDLNERFGDHKLLLLLRAARRTEVNSELQWEAMLRHIENPNTAKHYSFDDSLAETYFLDLPDKYRSRIEAVLPKFRYDAKEQLEEVLATMAKRAQE